MYCIYSLKKILYILLFSSFIFAQFSGSSNTHLTPLPNEQYYVDSNGSLYINVNIWGHVNSPGSHLVYDGVDLINLISIVGGPKIGANTKKIRIIRYNDNKVVHEVNLEKFYKYGDRSDFIEILPNDTIIIEEKRISSIFRSSNALTTILQILNIYLQITK